VRVGVQGTDAGWGAEQGVMLGFGGRYAEQGHVLGCSQGCRAGVHVGVQAGIHVRAQGQG